MLRIVSKADTAESFIQVFAHLCDRDSLFIVTRAPKEVGTKTRFLISLKTGEPVISGRGEVIERYEDKENPYGRVGMKLRFIELDDESRGFIERLVAAKEVRTVPPVLPPIPSSPVRPPPMPDTRAPGNGAAASVPEEHSGPGIETERNVESGERRASTSGEGRVQGSGFVLPANPFGELTDNVLEAFIECSLYEDMSNPGLDISEEDSSDGSPERPHTNDALVSQPNSAPQASQGTSTTAELSLPTPQPVAPPPAAPNPQGATVPGQQPAHGQLTAPVAPPPVPPQTAAPAGNIAAAPSVPTPEQVPAAMSASGPAQSVAYPMHASVPPGLAPTAKDGRRANWKLIAVVAGLAAVLSLAVGYMLWGKDTSSAGKQPEVPASAVVAANDDSSNQDTSAAAGPRADQTDEPTPADTEDEEAAAEDSSNTEGKEAAVEDGSNTEEDAETAEDGSSEDPIEAAEEEPTDTSECQARFTSDPQEATVSMDGEKIGTTPFEIELPCGEQEFRFTRPRREPMVKTVELVPGQDNKIMADLDRPEVELVVKSIPSGAIVEINGKLAGETPVSVKIAGFRRAKVELKKPGYKTYKKRIYPKNEKNRLRVRLKPTRRRRR